MKIPEWLKSRLIATVIAAVVGAVIGGTITGVIAHRIFQKQLLTEQYSSFAEDMQEAVRSHSMWKAVENEDARKTELKEEAELYLNRAWARALVALPDEAFSKINTMVRRQKLDPEMRNRVYYLLRKQLYPNTSIKYDDMMRTNIGLKE